MSVTGVGSSKTAYYQETVSRADVGQEPFSVEDLDIKADEKDQRHEEVPDKFAGTTFHDLINSGKGRKNQIPVVNQIVSSRNPEDGEIYRAFFTDKSIICNYGDGRRAWEIDIEDAQQGNKVKEFFAKREPDNDCFKEFYSGDNLGMAVVKKFWLDLFKNV